MQLHVFAVGGTIDKIYYDALSDYTIGTPAAEEIFNRIKVNFTYQVSNLVQKDSLDMTATDRAEILAAVQASSSNHIVVTHGTDTMVTTGKVLKAATGKTIVITGAMQPAMCKYTDADFNLGGAVACCQALPTGVYIYMNGRIYDVDQVKKNRAKGQFQDIHAYSIPDGST
jgi:L-asparaginase